MKTAASSESTLWFLIFRLSTRRRSTGERMALLRPVASPVGLQRFCLDRICSPWKRFVPATIACPVTGIRSSQASFIKSNSWALREGRRFRGGQCMPSAGSSQLEDTAIDTLTALTVFQRGMSRSLRDLTSAVVGTGFIGPVHVEALRRLGVRVKGVLGSNAVKSAQAAA